MSRLVMVAVIAAVGILGFAAVVLGIAVIVEYEWPRRLLGLLAGAVGVFMMFHSVGMMDLELGDKW